MIKLKEKKKDQSILDLEEMQKDMMDFIQTYNTTEFFELYRTYLEHLVKQALPVTSFDDYLTDAYRATVKYYESKSEENATPKIQAKPRQTNIQPQINRGKCPIING